MISPSAGVHLRKGGEAATEAGLPADHRDPIGRSDSWFRHRRRRLASMVSARPLSAALLALLLVACGVIQAINMNNAPQRTDAEGTFVADAWAVQHGTLAHYRYTYDHPPLGWIQMAAWTWPTAAFSRASTAVVAGREFMLIVQLVSVGLLWVLARRLGLTRWASTIAVALFGLTPLAVHFHRTVSIDNVATPWLLAAFILALTPRQQLKVFAASGACFGVAVLTKETSLLLLPALGWLIWRSTDRELRRFALATAGIVFLAIVGFYLTYASLSGQLLFPSSRAYGAGVLTNLRASFLPAAGSGRLYSPGAVVAQALSTWHGLDPVGPLAALVAAAIAMIAIPRLRPIALGFALLAAVALQVQYLPATYIVALIPFGALLISGVADWAWAWRPTVGRHAVQKRKKRLGRASRLVARPLVVPTLAVGVTVAVLAAPAWADQNRKLLDSSADRPMREATEWVMRNVPASNHLIVDDAFSVDLVRRKFAYDHVHWFYKFDTAPILCFYGGGCPVNNYIISTPTVRASISAFPLTRAVLRTSVVAARFGSGRDRVEVRRIIDVAGEKLKALQKKLDAERLVRGQVGAALARTPTIRVLPPARDTLVTGFVDNRVMSMLGTLAVGHRFQVNEFPVDPKLPLSPRVTADLVVPSAPSDPSGSLRIIEFLKSQPPPLRPRRVTVLHGIPGNRDGVRVTYRQPS